MKICMVVEGCYPYVVGGVSSWVHGLIQMFPEYKFVLLTIIANRSMSGKFVYELPPNVEEVHELYLDDDEWGRKHHERMNRKEYRALRSLILNQKTDWETLFHWFQKSRVSLNGLLMGEDFFQAVMDYYQLNYSQVVFSDFLWMMRSIYLPMFLTMKMKLPKADLYHCVCTGYAGIIGSMAKCLYGSRLLISEHGIYTREREEELVRAKWVEGIYKNIWIDQFRKMSRLAYESADLVTSLYGYARGIQLELGCPMEKTMVVSNGISVEKLQDIPGKQEEDEGKVHVGAIVRVAPIKDIKTMIQAFCFAKEQKPELKLWIMGPWEDEKEYARECFELVDLMGTSDIVFTDKVDVREYLGRMDMIILTSISEGQPLAILESFAAHKPVIATNVGNCEGLILGDMDDFGPAGIVTHIMNVEEITQAILRLADDEALRIEMGERGYRRVAAGYRIEKMQDTYRNIYGDFVASLEQKTEEE
ncbi:MAG: GT4 family glycosyltransferase PelF [Hespellia sp.]|nr:GT4 family glycosyltransferase PelF [Hespellia sp.]